MRPKHDRILFAKDEDAAGEELEQEQEAEVEDRPVAGAAAQSALKKERKARQDAEKRSRDLETRLKRIEDAEKSETERLRSELDELKERDRERETAVERDRADRERADYVRHAAKELKFADEDDTVALLRGHGLLEDIESEADAIATLKRIAKAKPHLVRSEQEQNSSLLDKVLNDGKPAGPRGDDPDQQSGVKTREQIYAMSDEAFDAWRQADPAAYHQSLDGLSGETVAHQTPRTAIGQ